MNKLGSRPVEKPREVQHRPLLSGEIVSPLGRLIIAGEILGGQGVAARPLRAYSSFAVMLVLHGEGGYRDARGYRHVLRPGDLVTVFPDLGHWYGPPRGRRWDEIYVTFDGPIWEAWRAARLLDPARPVVRLGNPGDWEKRLRDLLLRARAPHAPSPLVTLCEFQTLLAEALCADARCAEALCAKALASRETDSPQPTPDWLARARHLLLLDLSDAADLTRIAAAVGMRYETFRKRFQREVGVSPARWRLERRIDSARQLLQMTPQMTNRQLAATLGFADEYHFSRRFKEIAKISPRRVRQLAVAAIESEET